MIKKAAQKTGQLFQVSPVDNKDELIIEGLRHNNLKNLSLRIPHDRITAIVGPSGGGKSSLAFDTLFAEGRWRFMESLSTYTRLFLERMDRPDVDSIRNIRPAIAVEQKNPVRGARSTVSTQTELSDYLRLLFSRAGMLFCPECAYCPVEAHDPGQAAIRLLDNHPGRTALIGFDISPEEDIVSGLLKRGFTRVKAGGNIINISLGEELPDGRTETVGVITDRLILDAEGRARLVESLETAFREGQGNAWAEITGKDGTNVRERFSRKPVCPNCSAWVQRPSPLALSFNHPVGACPACKGFGNILRYDLDRIIPDKTLSLSQGAIEPWTKPSYRWWYEELKGRAKKHRIDLDRPFELLSERERRLIIEGGPDFDGIDGFFSYLETKKYKLHVKVFTSRYKGANVCAQCNGTRLKKTALSVRIQGMSIADVGHMTIKEAFCFFKTLALKPHEMEVSREVLRQIREKLKFLNETGLGYITLDRLTKTLSGGEAQRVAIASQLAASLTGVLYILDEPSIGLHPADTDMLIRQIKRLSGRNNTVVVVEHDLSVIKEADHIIELGPGGGERGGRVVYSGKKEDFIKSGRTITSAYLTGKEAIHTPRWRRKGSGERIVLKGAKGNNLKNIDVEIPLKTLTCVTGVSGSGKSSLIVDTLYNALAERLRQKGIKAERPLAYASLEGSGHIRGVRLVDQGPMGRTPRSNPVTYVGGFDEIRRVFAGLPRSRALGLTPGHFSFNVPGGRCEACKGDGVKTLEMYFLPDVYVKCEACAGKRYKTQVLGVRYRGKNIHDALESTFDEALHLFQGERRLRTIFGVVRDVGLGYLKLGQSGPTLSGGEAQRLKIAKELLIKGQSDWLYIFDEPTTGLHTDDVKRLLRVLGALIDAGNTVVMIEHNLDCIKTADHVIDMGPGGGDDGGRVAAHGTPEIVARARGSLTGDYLNKCL